MTGLDLQTARKKKNEFYSTITEVILPKGFELCSKIFIGGCVERGVGSSFRRVAHAHNCNENYKYGKDPYFGSLCFRKIERLGIYETLFIEKNKCIVKIVKPSKLVLHEYAHLLAPNQGHTKIFCRRYYELCDKYGYKYKADFTRESVRSV